MEKKKHAQLELFSGAHSLSETLPQNKQRGSFFSYARGYEKVILILMGFAVTAVISFCLGVEKGKNIAKAIFNSRFEIAQSKTRPLASTELLKQSFSQFSSGNYTIQIASYQNWEQAQGAVGVLKKKTLSPLLFSKGKYTIVCVGNFSNKEKALLWLAELKKYYKDCFIRRL
jgi:hypothetical protein